MINGLFDGFTPQPDFDLLRRAILRQGELERVPLLELKADEEVIAAVMGVPYSPPRDREERARFTRLTVQFWHELGYDAVRFKTGLDLPMTRSKTDDTAALSRGQRAWQSESEGPSAMGGLRALPWPTAADADSARSTAGRFCRRHEAAGQPLRDGWSR
jgi:hypothetical protein